MQENEEEKTFFPAYASKEIVCLPHLEQQYQINTNKHNQNTNSNVLQKKHHKT